MPALNQFRHQSYPPKPAVEPQVLELEPGVADPVDFSKLHSQFGVRHVEIVHGTFSGDDPFGISAWLHASMDQASESVQLVARPLFEKIDASTRKLVSTLTAGVANYSEAFRQQFEEMCGGDPQVHRDEPAWSGENHHLARASLAVKLLVKLQRLRDEQMHTEQDRILLWGHSHAGNGFAILTNLLANQKESVAAFFEAAGDALGPAGEEARNLLALSPSPHPLARSLMIATFGTPVRYGWDTTGCRYLMHVSHHRPFDQEDPARCRPAISIGCEKMSPSELAVRSQDILLARQGDWVQLFALAGTDLKPTVHEDANQRLGRLLEQGLEEDIPEKLSDRFKQMCPRWRSAPRTHSDGRNLLVQFQPVEGMPPGPGPVALLGHAVYVADGWLPAQLALVMDWLQRDGLSL